MTVYRRGARLGRTARRVTTDAEGFPRTLLLAGVMLAAGCTTSGQTTPTTIFTQPSVPLPPPTNGTLPLTPPSDDMQREPRSAPYSYTGQISRLSVADRPSRPVVATNDSDGISLNFVNAEIRDVARTVLGEVLHLTYAIDPQVQGQITLESNRPVPRAAALSAVEGAFRLAGAGLVQVGGVWQVVPLANAAHYAPLAHGRGGGGYTTQVVSLRWVAASELQKALEPLLPPGTSVRADTSRNILFVSGTGQDVADIMDNVAVFDTDALRDASLAFVPLHYAQARSIAAELPKVLGLEGGPAANLLRAVPIERLNAILITSLQPAYIARARQWIERLDNGAGTFERRIYVYRVQNGRVADIAGVLSKILGTGGAANALPVNPPPPGDVGSGGLDDRQSPSDLGSPASTPMATPAFPQLSSALLSGSSANSLLGPIPGGGNAAPSASGSQMRITADDVNNALLILASPQEWSMVQAALSQLDIPPLQVLIEASIVEVTLTGGLRYGLQYFINSGNFRFNSIQNNAGSANDNFPGFNLVYAGGASSTVILSLLEQLTTVKVLSSPDLLVLNNQKARLQVGNQVPVATQSAVSVQTGNAPIVNSIEYRDTGVILQITPRVNASGAVLLDVSQEVSEVSQTTTSNLDSPTIQQRRINSSVSVQDGQTIALGGLISDNRSNARSGIPVLKDLPYLGFLFGTRDLTTSRTELIVLITPHVVRDRQSARAVTDELRGKLPLLAAPLPERVR